MNILWVHRRHHIFEKENAMYHQYE
ncbi:uncharacterized protein METZ01_LOCUS364653, partial [marine metagenome]